MKYELGLSSEEIFELCKNLDVYGQKLESARTKILNRLADFTIERIKVYCPEDTGELINSITKSEIFEQTIHVFTDNAYAQYVEFGTGVIGRDFPHPSANELGWQYDINNHGYDGWYFYGDDGKLHWTVGEIGSRFMYLAFQDLEQNYMRIGKEVLKEEGLI